MVFARRSGAASRKSTVEHLRVGDQIRFHPTPVGQRTAAGAADLIRQHLDHAILLAVIVRFDDAVSVPVVKPHQPSLFDRRSQKVIELRIGSWHEESLYIHCAGLAPTYFCWK